MTTTDPRQLNRVRTLIGPFKRNKMFFVHIPKNAGTTVMRVLLQHPQGASCHATATQINGLDEYKDWNNFIFCRDPLDRFISVYLWRLRKDELIQNISMNEVVEMLSKENIRQPKELWDFETDPEKLDRMFNKQVTWINNKTVYVGRVEAVGNHMHYLRDHYGLRIPWTMTEFRRHENPAKTFGPQTPETRKKLINILKDSTTLRNNFFDYYAEDYERFGYNIPKGLK